MGERAARYDLVNFRLRVGKAVAGVLITALAVACSEPSQAPTTLSDVTTSSAPTTSTTGPSTTTSTTLPVDPPTVEAAFPQNGVAAPVWDDEGYGEPEFAATLASSADAGASWVTLIPTWYQLEATSSTIYAENPGRTTSDEALVTAIREAKGLGMEVTLKPHVDLAEGGSRITIEPSVGEEWFDSYQEMILHYARMAETEGVDQFIVGTELGGTSDDSTAWRETIAVVREEFTGPITYAANHDEFEDVEFWDDLDFIGVDAYFPLSDTPTTIISNLRASWEPIVEDLAATAEEYDRVVVFSEVGYPSQEGATVQPYNPFYSDVPSQEEQAAALQAMIDAVTPHPWFGGFHWWMWFVEDSEEEATLSYMPEGKIAGDILARHWAGE